MAEKVRKGDAIEYPNDNYEERSVNTGAWLLLGGSFLLLLLLILGIPAIFRDQSRITGPESLIYSEKLNDVNTFKPEATGNFGTRVDLSGEIDSVLNEQAFVVNGPGLFGDRLLVMTNSPISELDRGGAGEMPFNKENKVVVTGIVKEFDIARLETDLGIDLNEEDFREFAGDPVVVADRITIDNP